MNFKIEKETKEVLTASVENNGLIIVADYPLKKDSLGGVDATNVKLINSDYADPVVLPQMLTKLGDWVVKNHSNKFY
ncbi:hypothetical protein [Chryseobacterium sp.]|uniref:hypothetical protein n=1 Tax=Chryseobacterium sp. TaxID=1871047 RepID=UPI00289D43B5|nr:hypothetical protein [Chryseobacterium sp.]